jgi:hypothetical protein
MAVRDLSRLLLEAHDRRAWTSLGYATWSQYVATEYGFSKQRAFQLLDHGRFIRGLESATGRSTAVDLPERVSRDLKSQLGPLTAAVRLRTAHVSDQDIPEVVQHVAGEERRRVLALRASRRRGGAAVGDRRWATSGHDGVATVALLDRLLDAVDTLVRMPSPTEVLDLIPEEYDLGDVDRAAAWL